MRNALRILAFDVAPPLAAIAGAGVHRHRAGLAAVVGVGLFGAVPADRRGRRGQLRAGAPRRGDRRHRRRRARAAAWRSSRVRTAALAAAVVVGYLNWSVPDRELRNDTAEVVGIATSVAEASATFTPQSPTASIDRATEMMSPQSAEAFKNEFASVAKDLTSRNVSAQASTVSAGVEAIGPAAASVAVILRGTQNSPGTRRHRGARAAGPAVQSRTVAGWSTTCRRSTPASRSGGRGRPSGSDPSRPAVRPLHRRGRSRHRHKPCCSQSVFAPTAIVSVSTECRCSRRRNTSTMIGYHGQIRQRRVDHDRRRSR